MQVPSIGEAYTYRELADAHAKVSKALSKIRYKPNWSFSCSASPSVGAVSVTATMRVKDSTRQLPAGVVDIHPAFRAQEMVGAGQDIEVSNIMSIAWQVLHGMDEATLVSYIFDYLIMGMERHEAQEWYRFDGVVVRDPHKEQWRGAQSE